MKKEKSTAKKIYSFLYSSFGVILLTILPSLQFYAINYKEMPIDEILPFISVAVVISIVIHCILKFILHKAKYEKYTANILSYLAIIILVNGGMVMPKISYYYIVIIVLVLYIIIAILVKKHLNNELAMYINHISVAVLLMLVIYNTSIPLIFKEPRSAGNDKLWQENYNVYNDEDFAPSLENADLNSKRPNIYIIMPDEYAGFNQMRTWLDFDNQKFYDDMKQLDFNINESGKNYSYNSLQCMTELFNLLILEDNMTNEEIMETNYLNDARVFKLLEELGYNNSGIMVDPFIEFDTIISPKGKEITNVFTTEEGKTFEKLMIERSFLSRVYLKYETQINEFLFNETIDTAYDNNEVKYVLNTLSKLVNEKKQNQFVFAYIKAPHVPFAYNENGYIGCEWEDCIDWSDHNKYLNSIKYVNKMVSKTTKEIIEKDPDSIIMIMSDHGLRPSIPFEQGYALKGSEVKSTDWTMATNTLNMVYYKGEKINIEGLSAANTLITILNEEFGFTIEQIPKEK